jgi:metal-sulfur cluster biosynthetic enzyme
MNEAPDTNRPVWQAEADHPELCEKLRQGWVEVIDPELGFNILQLGLIRDVKVDQDQVTVNMILTTPFCPYGPAMLESTRIKAEDAIQKTINLELGMEPWDFSMMEEGLGGDWGLW